MMIAILFLSFAYAVSTSTEVVRDSKTNLEWQNQALNKTETKSWQKAIDYCEGLILDGKNDWRLPNINELLSLADYEIGIPAIVTTLKDTTGDDKGYWSTTTYWSESTAFYLLFNGGVTQVKSKSFDDFYVRCVRDY